MRRIDARSLHGLAHPLRISILEAVELDGPATSTMLAARLGENTGTISWHLISLSTVSRGSTWSAASASA